jgi:hypothetical protein
MAKQKRIGMIALGAVFCLLSVAPSFAATINPVSVPEAGALILFGTGLIGLVGYRRVRRMQ